MKNRVKLASLLLILLAATSVVFTQLNHRTTAESGNLALSGSSDLPLAENATLALRRPDEFNWKLLAAISGKAPANFQQSVPGGKTTNSALWETWADDGFTFPISPDPDAPPKWANRLSTPKKLTNIFQEQLKALRSKNKLISKMGNKHVMSTEGMAELKQLAMIQVANGGTEEVRRNEAAFTFIIDSKLWYQQGLACAFQQGTSNSRPNGKHISFPPDAVEIKAVWKKIQETDKSNYHWNYDGSGNLYGLTGLHIISKTLPNWTWVTFEWVGNPGRCDYLGCHDAFGVAPGEVAPVYVNGKASGKPYPSGTLTPELMQVFQDAGFDQEWLSEWQNYRLKGSQIDFTSTTGVPNLVGNSITERRFIQTSSCMTCHANAAIDQTGGPNPTFGFSPTGQSLNGPVLPTWFYNLASWDPEALNYQVNYYPTDFVWAIPSQAQPISPDKTVPICQQ